MNVSRLFQLIFFKVLLFPQIENVFVRKNNVLNILLMEYSRHPYKWQNKLPDFTRIILNEQLVQALNSQQHLTNVQSLYNEAISKIYEQIPLQDLVEQLWKVYTKYDVQSFIIMARAQLALYWRYSLDRIEDPYYVLLAAHCFHKIKNDVFFSRLDDTMQDLIDNSIKSLPFSLQYLFGREEFCLHNVQLSDIMLQTTDYKIDNNTSQVLCSSSSESEAMGLIQPVFEETEEDNLSDINLALVSKFLNGYFFRLPEYGNMIGANDTIRQLDNFLWSVELVDDNQLVFEQEEYLLCRNGSNVFGLKEKTIYDQECQWSAGECIK